jgi:nondiscriminating glutamyl-tRNA synthetase
VGMSDTIYDPEKLRWASSRHIAAMSLEELVQAVKPWLDRERYPLDGDALAAAVEGIRTHLSTFGEINEHLVPFFPGETDELAAARSAVAKNPESRQVLEAVLKRLERVEGWEEASLVAEVRGAGKEMGVRGPSLFHPVRAALSGTTSGPELGKILTAVGREEVLGRFRRTLESR